jgi:hypothetical protein
MECQTDLDLTSFSCCHLAVILYFVKSFFHNYPYVFLWFQVRCVKWPAKMVTFIYPWLSNAQLHAYYCHLCCGMCVSYLGLNYIRVLAGSLLSLRNDYDL